ncbi:MAG TPA: HD domain-containing phosphohydrolase [Thermoanaerobaculia bacterium]|nr:HD domain-containing phosphohydrolase [Thermoanaerobaculia bacterium]
MEGLITRIAAAVTMRTLYPGDHPRLSHAVQQMVGALHDLLEQQRSDSITFLIVGDDLVVEQQALRKPTLSQRQFVQLLQRRGIERLTLAEGLTAEEGHALLTALSMGRGIESSAHVILGRVRVAVDDDPASEAQKREKRELDSDQLNAVKEAFRRFRSEQRLPLAEMEQLVWSFIESLSRSTRAILPLAKLKEHDEYTFVHSVNVSLLVLAQARSFGIGGAMLHAFGLAALVHDIGKLMVPIDVLNHPGKLEGEKWAKMQSHAEQGAWYLGEIENSPPLSVLVAFEHHLRYDGQPAYPLLRTPRMPSLVSRMTSIADAYDAMSTVRPYQKPLMRAAAVEILKKRAESFYDPLLVANFARMVADGG